MIVYVIIANSECSSCLVNCVYTDKKKADDWVRQENKSMGIDFYYVEQSWLVK